MPGLTQLAKLKIMLAPLDTDATDDLLNLLLDVAESAIQNKRYPYGVPTDSEGVPLELETRWYDLQLQIAIELYNKRGAEGEMSHSANGITRSYEAGAVSSSLLRKVTPMCGGVR